jgi:enoyl-[acyl-carrier protein] reductase II
VAAAFCLGAQGVQIGTRFLCSSECTAHENYKNAVAAAKDRDAVVTGRSTGHPVRALKNRFTREFAALEARGAGAEELDKFGAGSLQRSVVDGDVENGSVMAGQSAGLVGGIKPCAEIIQELLRGVEEIGRHVPWEK